MHNRIISGFIAALLLPLLSSCAADLSEQDPRISHPVSAEQKSLIGVFDHRADGATISAYDKDRLVRLSQEALRRSAGAVSITVSAKGLPPNDATAFAESLANVMRHEGVTNISIQMGTDAAGPSDGTAEVRVPVWVAVVPECGTFERGMNPDQTNAPNSNWGCSLQRNSALMLQNPADLLRAQETSGRDANRASDVLGKYGRGEATGSAPESATTGTTSSVGH